MTFVSKIEAHPTNTPDGAYPAGTVAVATVGGMKGVRIFLADLADTRQWTSAGLVEGRMWHRDDEVTDVRPLVVLDPADSEQVDALCKALVVSMHRAGDIASAANGVHPATVRLALDSMNKPPRIPEPGLWGVVEAHTARNGNPRRFTRHADLDGLDWCEVGGAYAYRWDDLTNPTLIREGINA